MCVHLEKWFRRVILIMFLKGLTISEETYSQMEKLEGGRRELLRELKMVKEGLQEIYKTERFNETTGVGETKHGLQKTNVYLLVGGSL